MLHESNGIVERDETGVKGWPKCRALLARALAPTGTNMWGGDAAGTGRVASCHGAATGMAPKRGRGWPSDWPVSGMAIGGMGIHERQ